MPILAMSGIIDNVLKFLGFSSIQEFLIIILVLCISLSLHETAHGWVAYKLGDDTAYLAGRLTLNPLAHLDPIGSICFIIGGIGWAKPVPINPTRFDHKYSMKKGIVLTSLAGPGSNLLLAVVSAILHFITWTIAMLAGTSINNQIVSIFSDLFSMLYTANITLMVFNLLPIPPLDGFKVFGALLPNKWYYKLMQYERYIGMIFLALVLLGRGILSGVLSYVRIPFDFVILTPLEALFNWLWRILGI